MPLLIRHSSPNPLLLPYYIGPLLPLTDTILHRSHSQPENCLLVTHGADLEPTVKICDFGLSRVCVRVSWGRRGRVRVSVRVLGAFKLGACVCVQCAPACVGYVSVAWRCMDTCGSK